MSDLRDWKGYNEALVKRGLIFIDLDFVANWQRELKAMNDGKEEADTATQNHSSNCYLLYMRMFCLIGSWKASCEA
jgi:hypothetical protein